MNTEKITNRFKKQFKNTKRTAGLFEAVIGLIISSLVLFAKWFTYKGSSYTVLGFYATVRQYGGISAFSQAFETAEEVAATETSIVPAYLFLLMPLLLTVILVIRSVLLLAGKKADILTTVSYWVGFLYLISVFFNSYTVRPALTISMILMVADYFGTRMILEGDEMNRQARELKRKEEQARLDKLRRMRFPGHYSKDFYTVIFANFRSNLKGYLLFIFAASVSVAFLYIMIGALSFVLSIDTGQDVMKYSGVMSIFSEVIMIVLFLSIMLLVLIISNYIKTRMKNYGIFISLGIRKKTLELIIALEFLTCIVVSLVAGLLLGNLGLPVMKYFFLRSMGIQALISTEYGLITLITAIIFLLMTGLSTLINYHIFENVDITTSSFKAVKKEPLPYHLLIPGLLYGIYCIQSGIRSYLYGSWMEGMSRLATMLLGFLFLLYCGGTKLLKHFMKKKDLYLKHLFQILPWKYHFKTNAKYLFLLFTIQIFALSIYLPRLASCLTADAEGQLYPYDFVCMAHEEDDTFFQNLKAENEVEMVSYPMVRINTLLAAPLTYSTIIHTGYDGVVSPQGQHIGISETTYQKLKAVVAPHDKSTPNLKGKEIHVVFQQDTSQRARLLDWYTYFMEDLSNDPRLHAGVRAGYDMETRDTIYPPYPVKSQEKLSLTGMFQRGDQEDIVVFSDEYFEELRQSVLDQLEEEPTPTQLITLQAAKGSYQNVSDSLKTFAEKNVMDTYAQPSVYPYYEKTEELTAAEGDRFFKEIAFSITACILLLSSLFIFYLKYSLEIEEMKRRNQLLEAVGMNNKDRVKLLYSEMAVHSWWAFLGAAAVSLIFCIAMPVMRHFKANEIGIFALTLLIIIAVYTLLYGLGIHFLTRGVIRKIEDMTIRPGE